MRETLKPVYYCDFCRKYRLSKASMERHEQGCTMNPSRVCRWKIDGHSDGTTVVDVYPSAAELARRAVAYPLGSDPVAEERTYLEQTDVDWLHDDVDGCPACMLAALRQSGVDEFHTDRRGTTIFDYQAEVERLRSLEREEAEQDTW